MPSYLGEITSFDYKVHAWDIFKNRLNNFFIVNKITDNKSNYLLTYLSDDSYRLAKNLVHPKDIETLTFDDLVNALDTHFTPKRSTFADRATFYMATKESSETMEEWLIRLRGLAVFCDFGAALDTLLRDRFILGLPDGPERNRLFEQDAKTLTVAKALEVAQQQACVRMARTAVGGDGPRVKEEPVFRLGASGSRSGRARAPGPPAGREARRDGADYPNSCEVCGMKSHSAGSCRYKNYKCQCCGKKGHLKKVCSERKCRSRLNNITQVEAAEDSSGSDCDECKMFNMRFPN
ncbi:uncharacterized protein LOC119693994 [Plutella xylostella]|uniref:uncharacterized protein LOC119693994 n=1 Tax=Plutella xylostella TaxID=51655 RepID=UPI0020326F25|nr:uncharacterized protein LOC119693994 [Plutella xylostella]